VATGYSRGHKLISRDTGEWFYADDGSVYDDSRPCARCGRRPTPEEYDACLGHIPGAGSACCGHGVGEGWVNGVCNAGAMRGQCE